MASTTRKYLIRHIEPGTGNVARERIIEAPTRAAAVAHAARTTITVDVLGVDDAMRLASTTEVELATGTTSLVTPGRDETLSIPFTPSSE